MKAYPFIELSSSIKLLRLTVAILFMAHAATRIINGSIPQFGQFLERLGFSQGVLIVWLITLYELIAGTLIIFGLKVRIMTTGLIFIAAMGILLIHRHFGWFVGEHGTGGMEYSFSLIASLIVIAAADKSADSRNAFLRNSRRENDLPKQSDTKL